MAGILEEQELTAIMREYGDYLLRLSYTYVKNWSTSEEIVQDVFITFYHKSSQYEERASLKTYLAKITINKCHDYLRSWKTKKDLFKLLLNGNQIKGHTEIEKDTIRKLEQQELACTVLSLHVKYREAIVLYYYHDFSIREIAAMLNCSENTVKTRMRRGRQYLKGALTRIEWEALYSE